MLILIAGPYRSGTNDDAGKMADNLKRLEEVSWPLFQAGQCIHIVQPALLRPGYRRNAAIHVASLCNL